MTTSKIIFWHVDRNAYRGPRPKDLAELVPHGITSIIDLESGVYDLLNGQVPQFPADLGMDYFHMPCSDISPPPDFYVEKAITLMAEENRITYVHCLSGVDRTGYVCAAYRVCIQKWTLDAAVAEWVSLGRHPWYFYWRGSLEKFCNNWKNV